MTTIQTRSMKMVIYEDRKNRVLYQPGGDVDNRTRATAEAVLEAARNFIGTTYSGDHSGRLLKDSGAIVRSTGIAGVSAQLWAVRFTHRAAEVHYTGAKPYIMPKKTAGQRRPFYANTKRGFGPTRGPINRRALTGNPYLERAAQQLGLTVTKKPFTSSRGKAIGSAKGFV